MKISIRVAESLRDDSNSESDLDEIISDGPLSVLDALARLKLADEAEELLVIVDSENIPPGQRSQVQLHDGQQVQIFPPLKGG